MLNELKVSNQSQVLEAINKIYQLMKEKYKRLSKDVYYLKEIIKTSDLTKAAADCRRSTRIVDVDELLKSKLPGMET